MGQEQQVNQRPKAVGLPSQAEPPLGNEKWQLPWGPRKGSDEKRGQERERERPFLWEALSGAFKGDLWE